MNTSHISFIIPAYNASKTLKEAVNSIFNGNFEPGDEVIIVNDHSTDATSNSLAHLLEQYSSKIKVITNSENKGCPASRNIGISQAKNELIFNLDADNILVPGQISKLKEALIREKADVAAFNLQLYFKTAPQNPTHQWICNTGIFTLADLFAGIINQASGGNFLYTKSIWQNCGQYWEYGKGLHEAWGFTLKLLLGGAKFIVVPEIYYYHRYSHDSLFVRESKKQNESITISNTIITHALPLLDEKSQKHISDDPDWLNHLNIHPLYLKNGSKGTNGKLIYFSLSGKIKQYIKKFI